MGARDDGKSEKGLLPRHLALCSQVLQVCRLVATATRARASC